MGIAGLGSPYWYEWEVGILSCLDMLYDDNIESVVFQSPKFQSIDDVVVNYMDKSSLNIQVKHTDIEQNFTLSTLLDGESPMIVDWANDWKNNKDQYNIQEIRIVTNKKWGHNRSLKEKRCSFEHFVEIVLPKWKTDYTYSEPEEVKRNKTKHNTYTFEKNVIDQINKVLLPVLGNSVKDFIAILSFSQQLSLEDLNNNIYERLQTIMGTEREEPIKASRDSLFAKLSIWTTSRRKSEYITREDVYEAICPEKPYPAIPKFDLYPEKPIFPSRKRFAEIFKNCVHETNHRFIFLEGLPGCGKTNFVSYLAQEKDSIVDFRFYTFLPPDNSSPYFSDDVGYYSSDFLWGSILSQLRKKFSDMRLLSKVEFPLDYSYMETAEMRAAALKYLPIYASHIGRDVILFIDGLDHAARCKDFKTTFLKQLPSPDEIGDKIKFVLVGQPTYAQYPHWLQRNNADILFMEMPRLKSEDVEAILYDRQISFSGLDMNTLAEDIIGVVGNNTLNILFAIKEIERIFPDQPYEQIIKLLREHHLNGNISRYYEWILDNVTSNRNNDLTFEKLKIIFAFSSSKLSLDNLANLCGVDRLTVSHIIRELTPLITVENGLSYVFHNDFRIYLRNCVKSSEEFEDLKNYIYGRIINNTDLTSLKYVLLFAVLEESCDIEKLSQLFSPQYIMESLDFKIPLSKLHIQLKSVSQLIQQKGAYQYLSRLSMSCATLTQYFESVEYNCEEMSFYSIETPENRRKSEFMVLDPKKNTSIIIQDIYYLIKFNLLDRGEKVFTEYLSEFSLCDYLNLDEPMDTDDYEDLDFDNKHHTIIEKAGYLCRFFKPEVFKNVENKCSKKEIDFTTGWLRAGTLFDTQSEIEVTFTARVFNQLDLIAYIKEISLQGAGIQYVYDCIQSRNNNIPALLAIELGSECLIHRISIEKLQESLINNSNKIVTCDLLDEIVVNRIEMFFRLMFSIFTENDISVSFETTYAQVISKCRIMEDSRGYPPAQELFELAKQVFSMYYYGVNQVNILEDVLIRLISLPNKYGRGSAHDCGTYPVRSFLYRVIVSLLQKENKTTVNRICKFLKTIFIEGNKYILQLTPVFSMSGDKVLFQEIAEYWAGASGKIWSSDYQNVVAVCQDIERILLQFDMPGFAKQIADRRKKRIIAYVDHKDYSLQNVLRWYESIPVSKTKFCDYGMKMLYISDEADKIGDNRCKGEIEQEIFKEAIILGPRYIDALFDLKNTFSDFYFWREALLDAYYKSLDCIDMSDEDLMALFMLVNAWIKPYIENKREFGKSDYLQEFNFKIMSSIQDPDIKTAIMQEKLCCHNNTGEFIDKKKEEAVCLIKKYLNENGLNEQFLSEFLRYIMGSKFNIHSLITEIDEFLNEEERRKYVDKCVTPYILTHGKHGYAHTEIETIFEVFHSYIPKDTWDKVVKSVLDELNSTGLRYLYSVNRDLELIDLYYTMSVYPQEMESRFLEKLNMHWNWLSESGFLNHQSYVLNFDDQVLSLKDFVLKQIGCQL